LSDDNPLYAVQGSMFKVQGFGGSTPNLKSETLNLESFDKAQGRPGTLN
jgi:hypothetical protein